MLPIFMSTAICLIAWARTQLSCKAFAVHAVGACFQILSAGSVPQIDVVKTSLVSDVPNMLSHKSFCSVQSISLVRSSTENIEMHLSLVVSPVACHSASQAPSLQRCEVVMVCSSNVAQTILERHAQNGMKHSRDKLRKYDSMTVYS